MTRATKNEAKEIVATYGGLLIGRGVISEIDSEIINGVQHFAFEFNEQLDFPFPVECVGIMELATVLRAMWITYQKAYSDLGL
jgi:hypothetical protein